MHRHSRAVRSLFIGVLVLTLTAPVPARSAALSMGSARGAGSVELSLDDGKAWLSLESRSAPIMDGTRLRTRNGAAVIDVSDGSRLDVLPFSFVRVREASGATVVMLVHGRLRFHLPRETRVEIRTPQARFEPVRTEVMKGETFVAREGAMGLKMAAGSLRVRELGEGERVHLAGVEPLFLPRRPGRATSLFTSEGSARPPSTARPVFDPGGKSLGYLHHDGRLVVRPGYTADLTQPFPSRFVLMAMEKIPPKDRSDAVPVFDLNGRYEGYLAGPVFYAQAPARTEAAGEPADTILGMELLAFFVLAGSLGPVVGLGVAGAAGAFGGGRSATPIGPSR